MGGFEPKIRDWSLKNSKWDLRSVLDDLERGFEPGVEANLLCLNVRAQRAAGGSDQTSLGEMFGVH
jgi:hypothetical protein